MSTNMPSEAVQVPQLQASFVETLDRRDTKFGKGEGWETRKRPESDTPIERLQPLPAAEPASTEDNSNSTFYASRAFSQTVLGVGAKGSWSRVGRGQETTLTMAISANERLTTDMIHLAANRSVWKLTVRRADGVFAPVASGHFLPLLEQDRDYTFEIAATEETLTVRLPGTEVSKNVPTDGLLGRYAYWEDYSESLPVGVAFKFDTLWAVEDGVPVHPFTP